MSSPKFTIFTPTYNRAHTLQKVYNCLLAQTFQNFEWLIIDDGSSDSTKELVDSWQADRKLNIRYILKENGGKIKAFVLAIEKARGELFLTIDSDDECIPTALGRFIFHWNKIPNPGKHRFAGMGALCQDEHKRLIGTPYPMDMLDSTVLEIYTRHRVVGDKLLLYRTDVLREFPIPDIEGERRIASSLIWNRISMKYKMRFINEILMSKEYQSDGITKQSVKVRSKNAKGSRFYYQEYIQLPIPAKYKIKGIINYIRFSLHARIKKSQMIKESKKIFLTTICLPIGYYMYWKDHKQLSIHS